MGVIGLVFCSLGIIYAVGIFYAPNSFIAIVRAAYVAIFIYAGIKFLRGVIWPNPIPNRKGPCPYCKDGQMSIKAFDNYAVKMGGIPFVVPVAYVAICDKCGGEMTHAKEYKRWEKEFYHRYTGNLVRVSGSKKYFNIPL